MRTDGYAHLGAGAETLVTVKLYGVLAKRFGHEHRLSVSTPAEAVRALMALHRGFEQTMIDGMFRIIRGDLTKGAQLGEDELHIGLGQADLHIVPVVAGAGFLSDLFDSTLGKILAGIIIVAAAIILGPVGAVIGGVGLGLVGGAVAGALVGLGTSLILGGVSQLLSPTPKMVTGAEPLTQNVAARSEQPRRDESRLFGSIENVVAQGGPVPLIYGKNVMVGSTVISAGQRVEAKTDSFFDVVDLLGEGRIGGLVNGAASILLNGTPANELGFELDFEQRFGTTEQTPLKGFPQVQTEIGVNTDLTKQQPLVVTVNDLEADRVRLTIRGALAKQADDGSLVTTGVTIVIQLKGATGGYETVREHTLKGKSTAPQDWQFTIPLTGTGPWTIRVRRSTNDSEDLRLSNATAWVSYTVIRDHRLIYPDSALIGLSIPAEAFGGAIPSRRYIVNGRFIQVPVNYDPDAGTYDGDWDGTFKEAISDNPAWVVWNLLTERRAGIGDYLRDLGIGITKWDLYPIGQYCDGLVPDGAGGMERRWRFRDVIADRTEALRLIAAIASVFRGMTYWSSGAVAVTADMPDDPVLLVTPANVINGEFVYQHGSLKTIHNQALARWHDAANLFTEDVAVYEDPALIQKFGLRVAEAEAFGAPSRGQATRVCRWLLDTESHENETLTYVASWDHARLARPGKIIRVADPHYAGARIGGRLQDVVTEEEEVTGLVLDAAVTLAADQSYSVSVVDNTGAIAERAVTNAPGETDTLVLETPLDHAAIKGAMWVLSSTALNGRLFRILTVREKEPNEYEVTALFHDPGKYVRVELDQVLPPPVYTSLPTGVPAAPTQLQAEEQVYREAGVALASHLYVSWKPSPDPRVTGYEVEIQPPNDVDEPELDWELAAQTGATSVLLRGLVQGTYGVRVRAVAPGLKSGYATLNAVTLDAFSTPAPNVENLRLAVVGDTTTLTWDPVEGFNLSHYVVRHSPNQVGVFWGGAPLLAERVEGTSLQTATKAGAYLVKAVSVGGIESSVPAIATSNIESVLAFNAVELFAPNPEWEGEKENVIVTQEGALRLYGESLNLLDWPALLDLPPILLLGNHVYPSGRWTQDGYIDLGEVLTSRVSAVVNVFGANIANVMSLWERLRDVETLSGANASAWKSIFQLSWTAGDPAEPEAEWTEYVEFSIGDVTARAFRSRLDLLSLSSGITPFVAGLSLRIDVPDRHEGQNDVAIPLDGLHVTIVPPFRAIQAFGINAQGLAPGDRVVITNRDEAGFDVNAIDSLGAPIDTASFDWIAKGYGRIIVPA